MDENFLNQDDDLNSLLSELQKANSEIVEENEIFEESSDDDISEDINMDNLEQYLLNSAAKNVTRTDKVIQVLLNRVKVTPDDPELITSVAEMVNANAKAIDGLNKMYLNREKFKQASALEQLKQSTKMAIAERSNNPSLTRDELLKYISEATEAPRQVQRKLKIQDAQEANDSSSEP